MSTSAYDDIGTGSPGGNPPLGDKAKQVKDETQAAAGNAAANAQQVAASASQGVQQVAGEAREQAGQLVGEISSHLHEMLGEATAQFRQQAGTQTERTGQALRQFAQEVQALVEGRTEEAGRAGEYAKQAGTKLTDTASRLESDGFDGVLADLRRVAGRRPGAFLLGAGVAGFGAGRLIRSGRAAASANETQSSTGPAQRSSAMPSAVRPYDVDVDATPLGDVSQRAYRS